MTMNLFTRSAVLGVAAVAALTLVGCGSGAFTTTGTTPAGGPGTTTAASSLADSTHNDADVTFAQQMIVHHQGAIEMADLAPTRASSQQVKDLAAAIKAAQAPEITQMTGWLQDWAPETDMNGMPMTTEMSSAASGTAMSMPGMMSDTEMTELTAASGTEFDKLFLQMMIVHHQGAVEMADTELAQGNSPDAKNLAQEVTTAQTQEIVTMEQLLASR